jgi:hypothetical protein
VERVPLVTLSLAVIRRERIAEVLHRALLNQLAASLKQKVTLRTAELGKSDFILERRLAAGP